MAEYPTINFTGNKRKLTDWIIDKFPIKSGSVLDIFSGGGSVSYAFKKNGFRVLSNDGLYANYVISKAIIENSSTQLAREVFDTEIPADLIEKKSTQIKFLSNNLYFEYEIPELAKILCIADVLKDYEKALFLALLRRAMIRKLPYSRMNIKWSKIVQLRDEEYSYRLYKRRRAYHNQPFLDHMIDGLKEYNQSIFNNGTDCHAYYLDAFEMAKQIDWVDAVYMDPPYPGTTNNYLAFYGPFGTMMGYNEKFRTDFISKNTFCGNLSSLLNELKTKTKYVVLSLNTEVTPSPVDISKILAEYGSVTVYSKRHNYQLTGKENKQSSSELLMILDYSAKTNTIIESK